MATDHMKLYPKGTWIRVIDTPLASDNQGMIGKIVFVYDGWHEDDQALYKIQFIDDYGYEDAEFHFDVEPISEDEAMLYRLSN